MTGYITLMPVKAVKNKRCEMCTRTFVCQRSSARFCGAACRQRNHRARTQLEELTKRAEGELDVLIREYEYLIAEQHVRRIMLAGGFQPDGSMGKKLVSAIRKRDSAANLVLKSYATAPDASVDISGQAG